jgi:hypothetical protein
LVCACQFIIIPRELDLGNVPHNDWKFLIVGFLERCLGSDKRFRSPFVNEVVDLLFSKRQYTISSRVSGIVSPLQ